MSGDGFDRGLDWKGYRGPPSSYNEAIGLRICDLLIEGVPITRIANMEGMPALSTIYRWEDDHPEFARAYNRARNKSADTMDGKVAEIADECSSIDAAGKGVQLRALQWRAQHLNRKRYGDKQEVAVTGAGGGPVQTVGITTNDPVEAARAYQKMLSGEE